jgi:hypothetical protein
MNFEELLATATFGVGSEAETEGHLIVADAIAYLVDVNAAENVVGPAVLVVAPWLNQELANRCLDLMYVGSIVSFSGAARISGLAVRTGMPLLPIAFYQVRSIALLLDDGETRELSAARQD